MGHSFLKTYLLHICCHSNLSTNTFTCPKHCPCPEDEWTGLQILMYIHAPRTTHTTHHTPHTTHHTPHTTHHTPHTTHTDSLLNDQCLSVPQAQWWERSWTTSSPCWGRTCTQTRTLSCASSVSPSCLVWSSSLTQPSTHTTSSGSLLSPWCET